MDMLILGPFDTLKQGPRSRLMGVEDLWVRGEDKNKAWHQRMSFLQRKWEVFVILSKLDVSFVGKVVAEGKSKKGEESTVFSSCFCFFVAGFRSISPHPWEQLCISNPSKSTRRVQRGDGGALFESRFDAEAWWSSRRQAELTFSKLWGSCSVTSGSSGGEHEEVVLRLFYRGRSAFHQELAWNEPPPPPGLIYSPAAGLIPK